MASVEILRGHKTSRSAEPMLRALAIAAAEAGDEVRETTQYEGRSDWLILFGVGADAHDAARRSQVSGGGHALLWDLGYLQREKKRGHLRMSIDSDHPVKWLDRTPNAGRFSALGVELQEKADRAGPIILVGLGRKSRAYLRQAGWEQRAFASICRRFPGRPVIFRPKGDDVQRLACRADAASAFEKLLQGASLVVCRHSNCAVDAIVAGVPFEAEAGAASWLKDFTPAARLDFLERLAWWQWKSTEAAQAWAFAKRMATE